MSSLYKTNRSSLIWRELILVQDQLENGATGAVRDAILVALASNPTPNDTLVITDGSTTETYTFLASGAVPFDVTIGGTVAATLANLALAINTDSAAYLCTATSGLDKYFVGSYANQAVIYLADHGTPARIYGTIAGGQADFRVIEFATKTQTYDHTSGTESDLPAGDPGAKRFGFGRAYADLAQNETHRIAEDNTSWTWDRDDELWVLTYINDHGLLGGLADDDHSQYLLLTGRGGQRINDAITIDGNTEFGSGASDRIAVTTTGGCVVAMGRGADTVTGPVTGSIRSRGSLAAPTVLQAGDIIFKISGQAYNGPGSIDPAGEIEILAESVGGGNTSGLIRLSTNDVLGVLYPALDIDDNQAATIYGILTVLTNSDDRRLVYTSGELRIIAASLNSDEIVFQKSRGTVDSPTTIVTGDELGHIKAYGHDGSAYQISSQIDFDTEGTIASGVVPGLVTIKIADGTGALYPAVAINSNQETTLYNNLTVGTNELYRFITIPSGAEYRISSAGLSPGCQVTFRRARGTLSAPTIISTGDSLGYITAYGHDGTDYQGSSNIEFLSEGTIASGAIPGLIKIYTNDSSGSSVQALGIDSKQTVSCKASLALNANTPAQITGNQNDYDIGSQSFARVSSDASRDITGIASGTDGRMLVIANVGSFNIVFKNQDASSAAANRIITGTGADFTLAANQCFSLIYDATTERWRRVIT